MEPLKSSNNIRAQRSTVSQLLKITPGAEDWKSLAEVEVAGVLAAWCWAEIAVELSRLQADRPPVRGESSCEAGLGPGHCRLRGRRRSSEAELASAGCQEAGA